MVENILLDMVSVCLQFPWRVRRDSRADWHWICLLQLPQQRGHVPCVHKAALHRGGHPAGTVMQYQTNTPFMIHSKQSDRFPLGIVVPYFACCIAFYNRSIKRERGKTLVVNMIHFIYIYALVSAYMSLSPPSRWFKAKMQSRIAHMTVSSSFSLSLIN